MSGRLIWSEIVTDVTGVGRVTHDVVETEALVDQIIRE